MLVMWLFGPATFVDGAYQIDATVGFGRALAWAVPVAGIAQVTLVWIAAKRAGFAMAFRMPRLTPDLKRLAIIAVPAVLAGGVLQINLLVGRLVASQTEGAISMLGFADRLYQLPLGVVAIAIGVVLLPELSRRLAADDMDGSQAAFSRAGEISLALTVPAAVALIIIPVPLITALFERGAFNSDATAGTAVAVAIYGLGLPAFVLQKVLQPLFYAREDTRSPFRYAVISMIVNAGLALGLAPVLGFYAAAIATTLSSWAMVVALWRGSRSMGQAARFDAQFKRRIWRIVMASFGMGAVLWALMLLIGPMFGMGAWKYLGVTILVIGGMASYFVIGSMIGAFRISDFKGAMRR
jgi:putative peptidoglycan lipid II flippase